MRRRARAVPLTLVLAVLCLAPDSSADAYYRMLFERAVFLLETRIDPLDAIAVFQEIIKRHGDDRYYAARSQLHIALCYKKAGSGLAIQAFRDAIKNYPEQKAVAGIAEAELAALKAGEAGREDERGEAAARLVRRFEEGQRIGSLSGDGRYVVLMEMETDGLAIHDLAKRETRRLGRSLLAGGETGFAEQATISPDGARIVYSWRRGRGEVELRSIGADGAGAKTLLSDPALVGIRPVAWSPEGGRILAVLRGADAATRLAFVSSSDGAIGPVLDLGTRWPARVLLSPDGRHLAYSLPGDPAAAECDIFLYTIETKRAAPLVRQAGDDRLLAWTPDGRGVVYAGGGSETAGIWLMAVKNGIPSHPARWLAAETVRIDPVGPGRDGSLYFRVDAEADPAARPGGGSHELWIWPCLLPEKSRVLTVPDAFPTIQEAIDAASAGDTVLVRKGTYAGNIVIGKPLDLQGGDRRTTTITGGGAGSVVLITAGDVCVSGITVTGGTDGIRIGPGPAVRRVTLTDVAATHNSRDGISSVKSGGYHRIEDCVVSDNGGYGMNVHQFLRSVIRNCEILRNGTGLRPAWSWHILVEGNRIHHNRSGILVDSCYNGTISNNLIHANEGSGITVYYIAGRNTFKENVLIGNGSGIDIGLQWGGFGENRFYHNDLIGNRDQVVLRPTGESRSQIWDSGEAGGGNFWSDYAGGDPDGDGMGDLAYELAGGARDGFPLVKPSCRLRAKLVIDPEGHGAPGSGEWLTARIELPAGLPSGDVDMATLLLNGSIAPQGAAGAVGDFDKAGVSGFTVRFSRAALRGLGGGRGVTVTGKLKSGLPFEAREPSGRGAR